MLKWWRPRPFCMLSISVNSVWKISSWIENGTSLINWVVTGAISGSLRNTARWFSVSNENYINMLQDTSIMFLPLGLYNQGWSWWRGRKTRHWRNSLEISTLYNTFECKRLHIFVKDCTRSLCIDGKTNFPLNFLHKLYIYQAEFFCVEQFPLGPYANFNLGVESLGWIRFWMFPKHLAIVWCKMDWLSGTEKIVIYCYYFLKYCCAG